MLRYFPTFRSVVRFLRNNVTRPGRALLFLLFFSAIGLVYFETTLVFLFTAVATVLPLSAAISFLFRPNIRPHISAPEYAQAGSLLTLDIYLQNLRSRNAYEVFVEGVPGEESQIPIKVESIVVPFVGSQKTVRERVSLRIRERGVFNLPPLVIGSTFPFNLFRVRQKKKLNQRLIVTPAFHPLKRLELARNPIALESEADNRVLALARNMGNSEYIGNREYQYGMPVRRWDFSSWARTGKPIVREYRENQRGNVVFFIDTFLQDSEDDKSRFESILSLATAIAFEVGQQSLDIAAVVLGNQLYEVGQVDVEGQFLQVAKIFAQANRNEETDYAAVLDDELLSHAFRMGSSAVVIHGSTDESRSRMIEIVDEEAESGLKILLDGNSSDLRGNANYLCLTTEQIQQGGLEIG